MTHDSTPSVPPTPEEVEEFSNRLEGEFLSLLEQYAKDPGLLEGLEGACVAIVEREILALRTRAELAEAQLKSRTEDAERMETVIARCDQLTKEIQHGNHALVVCGQVGELCSQALDHLNHQYSPKP